jgi:hypothetical protein
MFICIAWVQIDKFAGAATSTCRFGMYSVGCSLLFGTHSFVLLCASSRRKHESASNPRFDFRLTIATLHIGSKFALLKRENEKTLPPQSSATFPGARSSREDFETGFTG